MYRFWLGIGLLVFLLLLGFGVGIIMERVNLNISRDLETAAQQVLAGDTETGYITAQRAKHQWERHWHGTASVSDHEPMDEIDGLFAQLEIYRQTGKYGDFAACCARISMLVAAISEAHSFPWWKLL